MNIIELINLIKPRPELFIGEHDIFCLEAFLNGWYYRNQEEEVKANILKTFTIGYARNIILGIVEAGQIYFSISSKPKKRL